MKMILRAVDFKVYVNAQFEPKLQAQMEQLQIPAEAVVSVLLREPPDMSRLPQERYGWYTIVWREMGK
jgi:hypothetical protein